MSEFTKTLIYKRTHRGDPDDQAIFGVKDCMGKVRGWNFDSVIGVGGSKPDVGHEEIAQKVTWIGLGPKIIGKTSRGPVLHFNWFRRYDEIGPLLEERAPRLFAHMFIDRHVRALLSQNLCAIERKEVEDLIRWGVEDESTLRPSSLSNVSPLLKCRC